MSTFSTFDIFAVRVRAVMQEGGHPNPKGRSKTVTCSDNLILYMKVKVLVTQCCPTFCNPMEPTRLLYLEFSREEHWNGLPFPPLGVKVLVAQLCLTLTPRINKWIQWSCRMKKISIQDSVALPYTNIKLSGKLKNQFYSQVIKKNEIT